MSSIDPIGASAVEALNEYLDHLSSTIGIACREITPLVLAPRVFDALADNEPERHERAAAWAKAQGFDGYVVARVL